MRTVDEIETEIAKCGVIYRELWEEEYRYAVNCITAILEELRDNQDKKAGAHRQEAWEKGWRENLEEGSLVPKYFGKHPIVRWRQKLIRGLGVKADQIEYLMLIALQNYVFKKYIYPASLIFEMGCGTGHNMMRLRVIHPKATIIGLDWTESAVQSVKGLGFDGFKYNMFDPTPSFIRKYPTHPKVVFTMASMEQLGEGYLPLFKTLITSGVDRIVHIEPIGELLDGHDNQLDYLSLKYFEYRGYLSGYLTFLREREREGLIKIVTAERSYVGSFFIDGYSIIVWEPI